MLILRKEAEQDIQDAYDWYEQQRAYLGKVFIAEIDAILEGIDTYPEMYAVAHSGIRRALCRKFPFAIYYVCSACDVDVIAVLHQRRSPSLMQERASRDQFN